MNKCALPLVLGCLLLGSHLLAPHLAAQDCPSDSEGESVSKTVKGNYDSGETPLDYKLEVIIVPGKMTENRYKFKICSTSVGSLANEVFNKHEEELELSALELANEINRQVKLELTCVHKKNHASAFDPEELKKMYKRPQSALLSSMKIRQSFEKVHQWLYSNCNGFEISLAYDDDRYSSFKIEGRRTP